MKPEKRASEMSIKELAQYIDHSVLKPEFTEKQIRKHIQEAVDYNCKAVCINPSSIDAALEITEGTGVLVCVVCDFPFGKSSTKSKCLQAEEICRKGIHELDMVANYGWIKSGLWDKVKDDIKSVNDVCAKYNVVLKVIMETDALSADEIAKATETAVSAGAAFVKTSTGFYTGGKNEGAAEDIVRLMLETANGRCKVKGSGGIRTREHFLALIDLGVDRVGIGHKSTPVVLGIIKG